MSFGLRVWDGEGRVSMDNVDSTGRYFGSFTIPSFSGESWQTLSIPGLDPARMAYILNNPTHIFFVIEMQPGQLRYRLTRADSQVGTNQPELTVHIIFSIPT